MLDYILHFVLAVLIFIGAMALMLFIGWVLWSIGERDRRKW